jgi:spore photoproduct lyase
MPDPRMGCPTFDKLVVVSNGCPFNCEWCFLQATYRAVLPYMAVHVQYEAIKERIRAYVKKSRKPVMFNNGELQDSLALEHITGAAQAFIPFFANLKRGYLFMLTKSDNIKPIEQLIHNGHTILAWSLNAPEVSAEFEHGAAPFEQRLQAAKRAQPAGYPVRIRLDPIIPIPGWQELYANAVRRIFAKIKPDRITLGTLRFEKSFVRSRHSIVGSQHPESRLLTEMDKLKPMLPSMALLFAKAGNRGKKQKKLSVGKWSYPAAVRVDVFQFIISQIRQHFSGPIALCKETQEVWQAVGLDPGRCQCVCQFDQARLFSQS